MERYILQLSELKQNHWVCTDRENMLMCVFEEKKFNETQQFSFIEEPKTKNPTQLARIANEMAEWLRTNHYKKSMP